jgi:hypothetical protein
MWYEASRPSMKGEDNGMDAQGTRSRQSNGGPDPER